MSPQSAREVAKDLPALQHYNTLQEIEPVLNDHSRVR